MTWEEIEILLKRLHVPMTEIIKMEDPWYASALGRPSVNITIFDGWLHQKFGNYDKDGKGMKELISEKFPDKIDDIEYMLGITDKEHTK